MPINILLIFTFSLQPAVIMKIKEKAGPRTSAMLHKTVTVAAAAVGKVAPGTKPKIPKTTRPSLLMDAGDLLVRNEPQRFSKRQRVEKHKQKKDKMKQQHIFDNISIVKKSHLCWQICQEKGLKTSSQPRAGDLSSRKGTDSCCVGTRRVEGGRLSWERFVLSTAGANPREDLSLLHNPYRSYRCSPFYTYDFGEHLLQVLQNKWTVFLTLGSGLNIDRGKCFQFMHPSELNACWPGECSRCRIWQNFSQF